MKTKIISQKTFLGWNYYRHIRMNEREINIPKRNTDFNYPALCSIVTFENIEGKRLNSNAYKWLDFVFDVFSFSLVDLMVNGCLNLKYSREQEVFGLKIFSHAYDNYYLTYVDNKYNGTGFSKDLLLSIIELSDSENKIELEIVIQNSLNWFLKRTYSNPAFSFMTAIISKYNNGELDSNVRSQTIGMHSEVGFIVVPSFKNQFAMEYHQMRKLRSELSQNNPFFRSFIAQILSVLKTELVSFVEDYDDSL